MKNKKYLNYFFKALKVKNIFIKKIIKYNLKEVVI